MTMMSETYEHKLAELRREIEGNGARPPVIDRVISELLQHGDERAVADLLSLLSDQAERDEGMFSLIHAAESFDDGAYVHRFLPIFPALFQSAPRWASIVLMRILNSRSAHLELLKQLRNASASTKEAIREMCQRINDVGPEFQSKTMSVMLAAS